MAIVTQIIGFYVGFASAEANRAVYDPNGNLLTTCMGGEGKHFADWCTKSTSFGFFATNQTLSNVVVVASMTAIFVLAVPFMFGLCSLFAI